MLDVSPTPHDPTDLIEAFRAVPTSILSDNLDRLSGAVGILPYYNGPPMCGRALTVRTRAGDNLFIHKALEIVGPGEVIVVDGGGDPSRALVGEIMKEIAQWRGAAGFIIDGAIRDVDAFRASDFPCFARAVTHRGPYKNGPGQINVPITLGGHVVNPGDIIVGDADGVVSFSLDEAPALLVRARAQLEREEAAIVTIRAGRYDGAYARG